MTLPENLLLVEGMTLSTFPKIVFFESNRVGQIKQQTVYVNRTANSFSFTITFNLAPAEPTQSQREYLTLSTMWSARAKQTGNYSVIFRAATNHTDAADNFIEREATSNITIVEEAIPTIVSLEVPSRSYSLGLNDSEWYVPPGRDVEVRCQVTCPTEVQDVTLQYAVWPSTTWSSIAMTMESHGEWTGSVPMQQEETLIFFRVEAFSSTGSVIKEGDKPCRFLDLGMVEHKAMIGVAVALIAVSVGCAIFFVVKRHNMSEL